MLSGGDAVYIKLARMGVPWGELSKPNPYRCLVSPVVVARDPQRASCITSLGSKISAPSARARWARSSVSAHSFDRGLAIDVGRATVVAHAALNSLRPAGNQVGLG